MNVPTTIVEVRAFPIIMGAPRSRPEIILTYSGAAKV